MKTAIVYYSMNGHTECAAKTASEKTGAELIKLEVEKDYPKGTGKRYFVGGMEAVFGVKRGLKPYKFDRADFDKIVLATPVWASRITPAVKSFIADNDLTGLKIYVIFCCAGGSTEACLAQIKKLAPGVKASFSLIDPAPETLAANAGFDEFCRKAASE